jgi:hypothetical protein
LPQIPYADLFSPPRIGTGNRIFQPLERNPEFPFRILKIGIQSSHSRARYPKNRWNPGTPLLALKMLANFGFPAAEAVDE